VLEALKKAGIRAYLDSSDDRMNAKIRKAQNQKVPHMLILGQNELDNEAVALRKRDGKQENGIPLQQYLDSTLKKIENKELL